MSTLLPFAAFAAVVFAAFALADLVARLLPRSWVGEDDA